MLRMRHISLRPGNFSGRDSAVFCTSTQYWPSLEFKDIIKIQGIFQTISHKQDNK